MAYKRHAGRRLVRSGYLIADKSQAAAAFTKLPGRASPRWRVAPPNKQRHSSSRTSRRAVVQGAMRPLPVVEYLYVVEHLADVAVVSPVGDCRTGQVSQLELDRSPGLLLKDYR